MQTATERSTWPGGAGEMAARVRDFDWSATPLGPTARWPQSLRTVVDLMLGARQPAYVAWGPELTSLYNDGYVPILGARHPGGLGRPFAALWAEIWDEYCPVVAATLAGEAQHVLDQPVALVGRPGRPVSWFTFSWTPVRDEAGAVAGFYCTAVETTEQVLAESALRDRQEAALRERETRLRLALDLAELGTWTWDLSTGEGDLDARGAEIVGLPPGPLADVAAAQLASIHPDDLARTKADVEAGIASGDAFGLAYRVVHPDGSVRHVASRARVLRDAAGRPVRLLGTNRDVTVEREAEAALRDREERQAFLLALSDALHPLADPVAIQAEASRLLGERLGVNRVSYAHIEGEECVVRECWADGVVPFVGRFPVAAFGEALVGAYRRGETVAVDDVRTDPRFTDAERANLTAADIAAFTGVMLTKGDRWVASLGAHSARPRAWTQLELELTREVAQRIWAAGERARAEAALRASEERLQKAMSIDTVGVLFFRLDGRVTGANAAFARMSGYGQEELVDLADWAVLTPPEFMAATERAAGELAARGETAPFEKQLIRKDGSRWWGLFAPTRLAGSGRDAECVEFVVDVTERKRAEQALQESEERYRTLFASIDEGFCLVEVVFDAGGRPVDYRFLEANPAFERHTGLRGAVGRTARELVPGLEEHWFATYGRVAASGEPVRFVDEAQPMGGRAFDVYAFRLGEPGRRQVAILFTDVTERRRAEADQARLAAIVESSWDAIVGRDLGGTITSWNPGAEALYGYAAEEIVGQPVARLLPPGSEDELADLGARLGRGERVPPFETVRVRKDGTPVEVEMTVSPIRDAAGRPLGVAAIARDIGQRRAAERQQQEFLEAVSHDLKNPLTSVRAQAQLLGRRARRGAVEPGVVARSTASIEDATGRLEAQLDELQDAARLRAGQPLELRAEAVDLVALAEQAAAAAQAATTRHRVRVEAAGPGVVGRWDPVRLRRVIDNLLGNALKYSDGGEVLVAVREARRGGGRWAELAVRDEGVGIPAADLPHVFERYRRGSNVGGRTPGAGIGLAGVRRIVEQHGGTIAAESAEGRGSVFTVALPLGRPPAPA